MSTFSPSNLQTGAQVSVDASVFDGGVCALCIRSGFGKADISVAQIDCPAGDAELSSSQDPGQQIRAHIREDPQSHVYHNLLDVKRYTAAYISTVHYSCFMMDDHNRDYFGHC